MNVPTEQQLHELYRAEFLKNGLGEPNMTSGVNRAVVGFVLGALQMAAGRYTLPEQKPTRSFDDIRREALRLIGVYEFMIIEHPEDCSCTFYHYSGDSPHALRSTLEAFSKPGWSIVVEKITPAIFHHMMARCRRGETPL